MQLKQHVYNKCIELLTEKVTLLKSGLKEITEAVNSETKSSVGDKHETSRAMMQLEQEKTGKQLKEAEDLLLELQKINIDTSSDKINKGSFIETSLAFVFIAVAVGKIDTDTKPVFVISAASPLGKLLIGAKAGDTKELNGTRYDILNVH